MAKLTYKELFAFAQECLTLETKKAIAKSAYDCAARELREAAERLALAQMNVGERSGESSFIWRLKEGDLVLEIARDDRSVELTYHSALDLAEFLAAPLADYDSEKTEKESENE
ncbi:MAG: hypothetical protein LBO72_07315 [Helicobacteraceae bacterium]|nr:hypothetical protein [Helicobacteraceae bacterium]